MGMGSADGAKPVCRVTYIRSGVDMSKIAQGTIVHNGGGEGKKPGLRKKDG